MPEGPKFAFAAAWGRSPSPQDGDLLQLNEGGVHFK